MRIGYEPEAAVSYRTTEIFTCCRPMLDFTSINTKPIHQIDAQNYPVVEPKPSFLHQCKTINVAIVTIKLNLHLRICNHDQYKLT